MSAAAAGSCWRVALRTVAVALWLRYWLLPAAWQCRQQQAVGPPGLVQAKAKAAPADQRASAASTADIEKGRPEVGLPVHCALRI
jgi:hypothetical protein